jgi:hypothetical protein
MKTTIAITICAAAFAATAGAAIAAPSDDAEVLIRKGVEQRRQGNHTQALELFERASAISPSARALAQRGLAETSLRRWVDAERHLAEALNRHDSAWIQAKENRDVLEKALAGVRAHVGDVRLLGTDGAEIKVNDQAVGRLPLPGPLRLPEGSARITAAAPGKKAGEREVAVRGGGEVVVRLDLEPEAVAPPPPSPAPLPAPTVEPVAVEAAPVAPPLAAAPSDGSSASAPPPTLVAQPRSSDTGRVRRGLAWGTAIVAVAALAGGVAETLIWQANRSDYNDPDNGCGVNLGMHGDPGCETYHESAERARLFAVIGYGAAAVLGATSTLLFVSTPPADARTARLSCAPDVASPGLRCRLTF